MSKLSTAVHQALTKFENKSLIFTKDVADYAKTFFSDAEIKLLMVSYLDAALCREVKKVVKKMDIGDIPEQVRASFLGDLPQKRIGVRLNDGRHVFKPFYKMVLQEIIIYKEQLKKSAVKNNAKVTDLEEVIRQLAGEMALSKTMTVEQAMLKLT